MSDADRADSAARGSERTGSDVKEADLRQDEDLRHEIARTRADMAATIGELEQRLNPSDLREKAMVELNHVETKIKEAVRDQVHEATTLLKMEFAEAKEGVKADLVQAKDNLKDEVRIAVENAKQSVRDATLGKVEKMATQAGDAMNNARDTLIDTIRQNPLPAAIAGIGVAWLLMNRSRAASERGHIDGLGPGSYRTRGYPRYQDTADRFGDRLGHLAQGASEAATGAVRDLGSTASRFAEQTAETASNVAHRVGDRTSQLAHGAREAADHLADGARSQARRVEQGFERTLENSPLIVGAAAVAAGAALGFALPRTRGEDQLMGEARDRVLHEAQDAAQGAVQAARQLAEKTGEEAKDAVRRA